MSTSYSRSLTASFAVLIALIFSSLTTAVRAQGAPDIVWMKGLGNLQWLFYSADGTLQAQVTPPGGSWPAILRIVRTSDEMVLHTYALNGYSGGSNFAFAPDGKTFAFGDESAGKVHCAAVSNGVDIWSVSDAFTTWSQFFYSADGSKVMHYSKVTLPDLAYGSIVVRDSATGAEQFRVPGDIVFPSPAGPEVSVFQPYRVNDAHSYLDFYDSNTGAMTEAWNQAEAIGYSRDGLAVITIDGATISAFRRSDRHFLSSFTRIAPYYSYYSWAIGGRKVYVNAYPNSPGSDPSQVQTFCWDIDAGTTAQLGNIAAISGDQHFVVSPDGATLAVIDSFLSNFGNLSYYNTSDGSLRHRADGMGYAPESLAMAPDGLHFATGTLQDINIWETETGKLIARFQGPPEAPFVNEMGLAWSRDGSKLCVSSRDVTNRTFSTRLISAVDGTTVHVLDLDPTISTRTMMFSPDGSLLITGNSDTYVHVWDAATGLSSKAYGFDSFAMAMPPSGTMFAVATGGGYGGVSLYDWPIPRSGSRGYGATGPYTRELAFSNDGTRIAGGVGGGQSGTYVFDIAASSMTERYFNAAGYPDGFYQPIAWDNANCDYLLSGYKDGNTGEASLGIFNTEAAPGVMTPLVRYNQEVGFDRFHAVKVAYTPDGQYFVYTVYNGNVVVARNPYWVLPKLSALAVSPASVATGLTTKGTVMLDREAPLSGTTVQVSASPADLVDVPSSVTVTVCKPSQTFPIVGRPVAVNTPLTISATYNGVTKTKTITVTPPVLTAVSVSPPSVVGGNSAVGTVKLSGATKVDTTVTLSSTIPSIHVPISVPVLAGFSTATFTASTDTVSASTSGKINATLLLTTKSASVTLKPNSLNSLTLNATSVIGGTPVTGTVFLAAPAGADTAVPLTSANPKATVPPRVIVPAGSDHADFTVTTDPVTASTAGAVSASYGGVTKTVSLTVKPPTYLSFTLTPNPVKGGGDVVGVVTMSGPVAVNTTVSLTNANAKATLPGPTVTIPAGSPSVSFTITTIATAANASGAVKATVGTVTKSITLKVTP